MTTEAIDSFPSRSVSIGLLMRVDIGNLNSGWGEGVVTPIKKIERPDGYFHPYISGQALRHYLRDTMKNILYENESYKSCLISPETTGQDRKSPIITEGNPRKYVDDDLFGFMLAIKDVTKTKKKGKKNKSNAQIDESTTVDTVSQAETGAENNKTAKEGNKGEQGNEGNEGNESTRKRTSPLRVSPAFGLFKLNSDRDLGTRSSVEVKGSADAGGSIFETEITNNIFRSSMLLELDRVGVWRRYETTDSVDWEKKGPKYVNSLELTERKQRIKLVFESLKYLWGGGRQSRFLTDLSPAFIIYARTTRKFPLFLNCLNVKYTSNNDTIDYEINKKLLSEVIDDYSDIIQEIIIGLRTDMFTNPKADFTSMSGKVSVYSPIKAIEKMMKDIESAPIADVPITNPQIESNQTESKG